MAGGGRTESGVDILHTTTIPAKAAVGTLIFALTLAVEDLVGSRFAAVASLWARWRPVSMRLEVIPSAGATVSGSYIVGWVADPDYKPGVGDAAVRTVATFVPSQQRHISSSMMFSIPADSLQKWYLTFGTVDGEKAHGALFGVLSSAIGNLTSDSSISFSLRLHWTIQFSSPRLPEVAEASTIYAEDDYTPYFTDSVSDWANGSRLSLKEREGGNLVPFVGAKPGVVYRIDSKAQLIYYKADGTKGTIVYGVRIPNYYSAALAVFDDQGKATAFARNGDSGYCLPYSKAGEYVTPNNPAWTQISSLSSGSLVDGVAQLQASNLHLNKKIHDLEMMLNNLLSIHPGAASGSAAVVEPSAPPAPRALYPDLDPFRPPGTGRKLS